MVFSVTNGKVKIFENPTDLENWWSGNVEKMYESYSNYCKSIGKKSRSLDELRKEGEKEKREREERKKQETKLNQNFKSKWPGLDALVEKGDRISPNMMARRFGQIYKKFH